MTISAVRPGDIVEVDKKGRRFLAYAQEREGRTLYVRPVDRRITWRTATAYEVVAHWRRAGRRAEVAA